MSLIKCPECGHNISEYADKCIYCGCPMSVIKTLLKKKKEPVKAAKETKKKEKVKQTKKSKPEKKPILFSDKIKVSDKFFVDIFTSELKERIPSINIKENGGIYAYRVGDESYSICWFVKDDNGYLVLKAYKDLVNRNEYSMTRISSSFDAKKNAESVYRTYLTFYKEEPNAQPKEVKKAKVKKVNKHLELYGHIVSAVRGNQVNADNATIKLCNEIAAFVLNEVGQNAIKNKDFKSMEEFNAYKYSRRYRSDFFDRTFSFRHLKEEDAKEFYLYYKASRLIDVIRRQEDMFKEQIVSDYYVLIKSLYKMIKYDELDYSRADGLLSTFNYVPTELLDEVLEKLESLEK